MAKKKTEKPDDKIGKVINLLKKEYPFEGLLLGILGALVLVLGIYIFEGELLQIRLTDWFIFATDTRINIFASIVMVIGAVALVIALAPFFVPGLKEMRRVSWPDRKTLKNHTARVFGFMIILALFFVLYDLVFAPIFDYLYGLGA